MMKSFSRPFAALLLIIATSVAACSPVATPVPPTRTIAPRTPTALAATPVAAPTQGAFIAPTSCAANDFDSQCAYAQNQMLAVTLGVRVAGSPSGTRAGDYIAEQFKGFGYAVEKQEFTFEPWEDFGTKALLTSPDSRELEVIPIQFSSAGHLEGEVVAVGGAGEPADFEKANVKGKIALVQRGTLQFADKSKNAADAGAAAVIIYNNAPQLFGGTMREQSTIPTLAMSGRESEKILSALGQGSLKIRIDSDAQVTKKVAHNIIATKPGTNGKTLVLGGHYDTVLGAPGANDNGSGTAVLIELARVLAKRDLKYTVVFVGFDAEEYGLIGSRYFTDHLSESDKGKITAMLNFDMLAGGKGSLGLGGDGNIAEATRQAASSLGVEAQNFKLGNNAGSDHQSFTRLGIDSVFFSRDYDLLHTPQDSIDQIHADWLGEAGRVAFKALLDLNSK